MPSPVRRSTRGAPAPSKTTPPASNHSSSSLSSEPPRRSQRSQAGNKDASPSKSLDPADDADDEPGEDEEEITRCICGQQEYPGPPLSEAFAGNPDANSEDAGGLFILCDGCSVWQHGGCVGIIEESQSPEKYYCEECRPKLHDLHVDSRGQKYSLYLPLHPKLIRKNSVSKSDEKAKKEREALAQRASVDPSTGKRRATTRSKEYDDEEEQLKRAIEESRREVEDSASTGKRSGKRSRDESEETKPDFKRQRTASESLPSVTRTASQEEESETDATGNTTSKSKKAKAEAVQSARQAEQREKDKEREKARAEAAGRRQERAGRRRGDGKPAHTTRRRPSYLIPRPDPPDPADESTPRPLTDLQPSPPPPSSQPASPPPVEKVSHKKGAGRKAKKLGNNQYTKNRGEGITASPHGRRRHENRTGSGDEAGDTPMNGDPTGNNGGDDGGKNSPGVDTGGPSTINGKAKSSKGKKGFVNGTGAHPGGGGTTNGETSDVERTFTNMKTALDAMSAWVTRQQPPALESVVRSSPAATPRATGTTTSGGDENFLMVGGAVQSPPSTVAAINASLDNKNFEDLTSAEMALRIQQDITSWQEKWGHLAST